MSDVEGTLPATPNASTAAPAAEPEPGRPERRVEPKFFHAQFDGKAVLVVSKTRSRAANTLARMLANKIEESLQPASALEVYQAGQQGVQVIDCTGQDQDDET